MVYRIQQPNTVMNTTSKYRILKRFNRKDKAEDFRDNLMIQIRECNATQIVGDISVWERKFTDKDKKRWYVREQVKRGTKR